MPFEDAWNPKDEEIVEWSYSEEGWPVQDFDLAIITEKNDLLLIELAKDPQNPKRSFFIHLLYLLVGEAIYQENKIRINYLSKLITEINVFDDNILCIWKKEALDLIDNKIDFEYSYWCAHMYIEK
jgi:hypothetical protein